MKHLVNETLRVGLKQVAMSPKRREPSGPRRPTSGHACLAMRIAWPDVLAVVEGESYK